MNKPIEAHLEQLAAEGERDSEGCFTLDAGRAHEVSRRFRTLRPYTFVLDLAEAAVLSGASQLVVKSDPLRGLRLLFPALPGPLEALERLWEPQSQALRCLAQAVNTALGMGQVQLRCWQAGISATLSFQGSRILVKYGSAPRDAGTQLRVKSRAQQELQCLRDHCHWAPFQLAWGGLWGTRPELQIQQPHLGWGHWSAPGQFALFRAPLVGSARWPLQVSLLSAGGLSRIGCLRHGILLGWLALDLELAGFEVLVERPDWTVDASGRQVVLAAHQEELRQELFGRCADLLMRLQVVAPVLRQALLVLEEARHEHPLRQQLLAQPLFRTHSGETVSLRPWRHRLEELQLEPPERERLEGVSERLVPQLVSQAVSSSLSADAGYLAVWGGGWVQLVRLEDGAVLLETESLGTGFVGDWLILTQADGLRAFQVVTGRSWSLSHPSLELWAGSPQAGKVATFCAAGHLRSWCLASGALLSHHRWAARMTSRRSLRFTPEGGALCLEEPPHGCRVWDLERAAPGGECRGNPAYSPDGAQAALCDGRRVYLVHPRTLKTLQQWAYRPAHPGRSKYHQVLALEGELILLHDGHSHEVWDMAARSKVRDLGDFHLVTPTVGFRSGEAIEWSTGQTRGRKPPHFYRHQMAGDTLVGLLDDRLEVAALDGSPSRSWPCHGICESHLDASHLVSWDSLGWLRFWPLGGTSEPTAFPEPDLAAVLPRPGGWLVLRSSGEGQAFTPQGPFGQAFRVAPDIRRGSAGTIISRNGWLARWSEGRLCCLGPEGDLWWESRQVAESLEASPSGRYLSLHSGGRFIVLEAREGRQVLVQPLPCRWAWDDHLLTGSDNSLTLLALRGDEVEVVWRVYMPFPDAVDPSGRWAACANPESLELVELTRTAPHGRGKAWPIPREPSGLLGRRVGTLQRSRSGWDVAWGTAVLWLSRGMPGVAECQLLPLHPSEGWGRPLNVGLRVGGLAADRAFADMQPGGPVRLRKTQGGSVLLTLHSLGPDWLVTGPEGLFDGTPGGISQLARVRGGQVKPLSPADRSPGLLSRLSP